MGHRTVEMAKTVMEVADMAWTAMELHHHHNHNHNLSYSKEKSGDGLDTASLPDEELDSLRSENQRLRNLLQQNLKLLQNLSESPCLSTECPPDLHDRLVATVDSASFLSQLESHQKKSVDGADYQFPFKEASGADLMSLEVPIKVDLEEPSWWVWVTDEMIPRNVEEKSEIDNDNYVIINEEHVVDGVANFMARCILSNPKAKTLTPEELQKTVSKALGGLNNLEALLNIWHAGVMFYTLSMWGLALIGLYKSRAVLKVAAKGVHSTSKIILRAL